MKLILSLAFFPFLLLLNLSAQSEVTLDSTFGTNGLSMVDIDQEDHLCCQSILPDGRIIVGANVGQFAEQAAVVRFTKDGLVDVSFGVAGVSIFEAENEFSLSDLGFQSDGKIILVGRASNCFPVDSCIVVGRLDSAGFPDNTFGNNGFLILPTTGVGTSVAVQQDDKIIVGIGSHSFKIVRLMPNGAPHTTFGENGLADSPFLANCSFEVMDLTVQPDGKILAAGHGGANTVDCISSFYRVKRYNQDGSDDLTFGQYEGSVHFNCPDGICHLGRIRMLQEGKIMVTGIKQKIFLHRILPSGHPDESFSDDGKIEIYTNLIGPYYTGDFLELEENSIITMTPREYGEIGLRKFRENGAQVYDFAGNDVVFKLPDTLSYLHSSIEFQDEKIIVAGASHDGENHNICLARIRFSETLSPSEAPASHDLEVQLIPNPISDIGRFIPSGQDILTGATIRIHDAWGRMCLQQGLDTLEIDLNCLPAGMYGYLILKEGAVLGVGRMIKI